jgi:hypothetical protein
VERTELNNLRGRAEELLKGGDTRFHEWTYSGQPWWGLAEWVNHKVEPVTWAGRVEDLASLAWGAGEYAVLRYRSDVSRASPILSTSDLGDFLERLLRLAQRLIGRQQLTTVLRTRFNLVGDEAMQPLGDEDAASADTAEQAIEEAEADRIVALVLEEATPREFEAFRFYHGGATFEEVGALLSVSRGTAENDLKRIGSKIDRFRGDLSRRQVVEKLLDTLS